MEPFLIYECWENLLLAVLRVAQVSPPKTAQLSAEMEPIPCRTYLRPSRECASCSVSQFHTLFSHIHQSTMSDSSRFDEPKLDLKRWKVGPRLGSGGFGDVYLAKCRFSGKEVAIKFSQHHWTLAFEYKVYRHLKTFEGTPNVLGYGKNEGKSVLVVDLLGPSLEILARKCGGQLSSQTVLQIGIQVLYRIEYIHEHGYLHRDLKPDNILVGRGQHSKCMYIIDFGISRQLRMEATGLHIAHGRGVGINGTYAFCSLNAHRGNELSRRDDLISLGYLLTDLCHGDLPWKSLNMSNREEVRTRVIKLKEKHQKEGELFRRISSSMKDYMKYVSRLHFEQRPDYSYLRNLFRNSLKRMGLKGDGTFDWEKLKNFVP